MFLCKSRYEDYLCQLYLTNSITLLTKYKIPELRVFRDFKLLSELINPEFIHQIIANRVQVRHILPLDKLNIVRIVVSGLKQLYYMFGLFSISLCKHHMLSYLQNMVSFPWITLFIINNMNDSYIYICFLFSSLYIERGVLLRYRLQ